MSTFAPGMVTCPACQCTFEAQLATSINVTRSPEHGVAIRDGSFHRWKCPSCAERFEAIVSFVYLDFERKIMIGVHPEADLAEWRRRERETEEAFETEVASGAGSLLRGLSDGFRVRTVFGLAGLREKLVAFDADLDDLVVELVKLRLQLDDAVGAWLDLRLTAADDDVLIFVDGRPAVHRIGPATYRALEAAPPAEVVANLAAGSWCDARRVLALAG